MDWLQEIKNNKELKNNLISFLEAYGISGLEKALFSYVDMQQEYICKTKTSISKIKIHDIYYLQIRQHTISVHTSDGIYNKYGTLNQELQFLSSYNFVKCSQSCIVSLNKIKSIQNNDIILCNNTRIHMSRNFAPKIISRFTLDYSSEKA